ncbi:MAG TPA: metallophosphoesterase [Gemmatimonadaceae bacterium]|nr:metallophosphoesterase [Gemmatimonadaceae bacterium]
MSAELAHGAVVPLPVRAPSGRGRGRPTPVRRRATDWVLEQILGRPWVVSLSHRAGLQGRLRLVEHRVQVPGDASRPTLRIGFASDFHAGSMTHPRMLEDARRLLATARPDILLFGGDFVVNHAEELEPLLPILAELRAPLGTWAVLGNHDLCTDDTYVAERLRAVGVRVLVNEGVRLPAPHDDLWLGGLDDPTRGAPDPRAALHGAGARRLILMHSPDGLRALDGHEFDLALCGHVHGGQIVIGDRMLVPPEGELNRRYPFGVHVLPGGARLLVSRGVGCSGVPVRIGAPPEVHVVEVGRA